MKTSRKIGIPIIILGILLAGWYFLFSTEVQPSYKFIAAERKNLLQEVSVTGKVQAITQVDLAFERGGKIDRVSAKIGDTVSQGKELLRLQYSEYTAELEQKKAAVEREEAKLETQKAVIQSENARLAQTEAALEAEQSLLQELQKGVRPEETRVVEIKVENAKVAIFDAQTEFQNTKKKAERDMESLLNESVDIFSSLKTTTDKIFSQRLQDIINPIRNSLKTACKLQITSVNPGNIESQCEGALSASESLQRIIDALPSVRTSVNILESLSSAKKELLVIRSFLESLLKVVNSTLKLEEGSTTISDTQLTTFKTSVTSSQSEIETAIEEVTAKMESIEDQTVLNKNSIDTAQNKLNIAESTLSSAESELELSRAKTIEERITAEEAKVHQAEANLAAQKAQVEQAEANLNLQEAQVKASKADVQNVQAQIAKAILKSPIDGIVTKQDAKIGEIVGANIPLITVISHGNFEIECNLPEVDIAKISLGQEAKVTLDAYGSDVEFSATIIAIDPAETVIEGVSTYKVRLQFSKPDERIKSGMTANIDVVTASRENVLVVPQRAVFTKDKAKFLQILVPASPSNSSSPTQEILEEREVVVGLKGSDGSVEILEGLREGEKVVTSLE
ncbi:efflux RND transporter periplasmic adaptor subunit [Candidatus Peregrinibacteria bacterium]|nr:efflux RND transporter periplasmic adaptor subunit [Candidatus Peregrinibacteria bacterium]